MLKVPEVAKRLSCSIGNAYALIESGQLQHFRVGASRGGIRVTEEQLQVFLESTRRLEKKKRLPLPRLKHIRLRAALPQT